MDLWRHPLVLAVIDKVLLGLVALAFGFLFQRRLERHKRNEALTSEVAKLRIAAYYRVLGQVGAVRRDLARYEYFDNISPENASKMQGRPDQLLLTVAARQHLLNDSFVRTVRQFAFALQEYLGSTGSVLSSFQPSSRAVLLERLREIAEALPQYVRLPETEDFFKLPPATPARRS